MRIGIDLDGVCYDFAASLRQYLGMHVNAGNCSACIEVFPDPVRWEFYEDWEIHPDMFAKYVREGTEAGVVFRWGEPHPGTAEALKVLLDRGHTLVFVTDRVRLGGEKAKGLTHEWLYEHFPFLCELHPIDGQPVGWHSRVELHFDADKTAYNTDIFLDDRLENYEHLVGAGMGAVLWDRPWNRDESPTDAARARVSSWDEFLAKIEVRAGEVRITSSTGEVRVTSPTGGQKGKKLARPSLIPKGALRRVAELYGRGAEKYDDWNWRKGYNFSLSMDALERHYYAWSEGEQLDPETGCHHLAAVVFHALSLITFEEEHPEFDDRWKGDAA
jgi:5'(3')-deoxyribonucleotidase